MKRKLILLLSLILANCLSSSRYYNNCNLDNINQIDKLNIYINEMVMLDSTNIPTNLGAKADKIMTENGYILKDLKRHVYTNKKYYYIRYIFVKKGALGGGGSLVFNNNLKVIAKCFEQ